MIENITIDPIGDILKYVQLKLNLNPGAPIS